MGIYMFRQFAHSPRRYLHAYSEGSFPAGLEAVSAGLDPFVFEAQWQMALEAQEKWRANP